MTREEFDKILSGENYRPRRSREEFNELIGIPAPQRKSTVTQPQNQQTAPPTSAGLPVKQSLPYDRYGYRKPSFGESAPRGSYMDYWEYQKKSNPLIDPPRAMTENDPSIGDMAKAALDTVVYGTASKAAQLVTYGLNQQAKMGQETEAARQELFSRMREGPPLDYNDKDIQQLMSQSTGMGLLPFSLKDRDPTTKDWITQHFEDKYRTGKELLLRGKSGPEQFFTDALLSSGQMLGDAAISSVTGIPVPVYAGLTGGAEAGQKALDEGYSADQAAMMALGSGAISAGVESIGGFGGDLGEAVGKKLLSSGKVPQKIVDYVSKLSGNKLVELLGDAASEGGEEFLEYDLQRLYENLILDKDTPRDIKEQLHNTAIGAFAGGLYGTARQATDFLSSKLNKESGLTSGEVQANSDPSEEKTLISLEEFKDTQADVWRNVDYSDQQTKAQITSEVSDEMLSAGEYVELQDADLEKFASYFPDLRSQKKADRIPVIRQKTAEVKLLLRNFLEQNFKGKPIELNLNGRILEAKLHDVGIKEVLEKITQTKAATIDKTGEIFSKAKYLYSTQDKAGNPNIYRWNYFYVPLKIGDDTFGVRIAVRDIISSNESQIYNYGIKKEATLPGGPGGRNPSGTNGTSVASFNPTLPQPRNNVNAAAGLPEAPKPHLPTATEAQANQAEPRGQLGAGLPYAPGYETQLSGERFGISQDKIDRVKDIAKRTGVTVEFTDQLGPGRDGLYLNGKIYISKDAKSPIMAVLKHELTHYIESSKWYNDFQNFVMDSDTFREWLGGKDVAQYRAELIEDYANRGIALDEDGANREIVARFVSEKLFTSDAEIGRLTTQKPNLAKRIYQWIQDTIKKLTGTPEEKFLIEARRKYEKALQTVQDRAGQAQYSINPDFGRQVDEWFRKGRPSTGYFYVGNTSEALKSVGITDGAIYFDQGKINKILNKHAVTRETIKQIPGLLENPIVILESRTQPNSVVVFGDVYDANGYPVLTAVQMGLKSNKPIVEEVVTKVTSAYGKEKGLDTFINDADLLYLDTNKERTSKWFQALGLQLPARGTLSGSIRSISYVPRDSNGNFSFGAQDAQPKTAMQAAMEKAGLQQEDGGQYAIAPPETRPESTAKAPEAPRPGEKESAFSDTLQNKQSIFDERFKKLAWDDRTIRSYKGITNRATLEEANAELNDGGESYVVKWMGKDPSEATAKDVAAGFLMMDRYQQVGDYDSMVEVAEHLRKMGTSGGQTIQMFSIFSRMTPEGMIAYAQKSLSNAFDAMSEGKTQKWIDQNRAKFRLTGEDVDFIRRRMLQAEKLPAGRDKNILLGEVAARIQGKIPPAVGNNVRALARISMLLNPKTNVRNVVGNALLAPIHVVDDFIGSGIDKAIAKKTGVRTTGNFDVKSTQGFKKGFYESYDDFRRRINTREISGDRFEIGSGPSFNENHTGRVSRYLNPLSKSLNALDRVTSFLLDAGDRPFYETWFINSLNNQMKLNNVTEPTADMIDIATQEALQRTWQDNNGYTDFVKGVRKGLNKLNIKGYGLGDMVITFAKTPANLTKAVVDFSPVGLVKSLAGQGRMLNNAIKTGKATPQMQRAFVKSLSEGISGTLLMILWGAMANAGSLSGKGDDDKDVRNFERNVLGIQPYSVKVGDKSYSYEWASPLGTSMAIAADFVDTLKTGKYNGYFQGGSTAEELANAILSALQSGGSVLYNQSFMQGLQNLFKEDSVIKGIVETLTDEPAKFTPQVLGQTAQLFDGTARQTYEYGKPVSTAMNKVKAKIPGLRNQLEPSLDVLGREIKTHDDAFNVYFNPANNTAARATQESKEMYRLYQKTGDKAVIPPAAPYYIEIEDKKQILSPKERNKFQKVTGKVAVDGVKELTKSNVYKRLSDSDKADIVKDLYSYGNALAKSEVSDYQLEKKNEKIYKAGQKGVSPAEYLLVYSQMDTDGNNSISQEEARQALDNTSLTREQKAYLFALQNSAWKSNPYRYTARSATTKNIARWSARR